MKNYPLEKRDYSLTEAAHALNVSRTLVTRWVREGVLTAHQLPGTPKLRVTTGELLRFCRKHGVPAYDVLDEGVIPALVCTPDDHLYAEVERALFHRGPFRLGRACDPFECGVFMSTSRWRVVAVDAQMGRGDALAICRYAWRSQFLGASALAAVVSEDECAPDDFFKAGCSAVYPRPFDVARLCDHACDALDDLVFENGIVRRRGRFDTPKG